MQRSELCIEWKMLVNTQTENLCGKNEKKMTLFFDYNSNSFIVGTLANYNRHHLHIQPIQAELSLHCNEILIRCNFFSIIFFN